MLPIGQCREAADRYLETYPQDIATSLLCNEFPQLLPVVVSEIVGESKAAKNKAVPTAATVVTAATVPQQPPVESAQTIVLEPRAPGRIYEGFKTVAMRAIARNERPFPVLTGAKKPAIANFQNLAQPTVEWVEQMAAQFPDAGVGIVAKPDEYLFIDEDESEKFRRGYEVWSGETFPSTHTTESRPDHRQSHWKQTDATRSMGNISQRLLGHLSVRQKNLYVLAEGSLHPKGSFYDAFDSGSIIPMPDKLVEYILYLKANYKPIKSADSDGDADTSDDTHDDTHSDAGEGSHNDPAPRIDDGITVEWGGRNDGVSRFAYHEWVLRMHDEETTRTNVHEYNRTHCNPAMPDGEVETILKYKLQLKQTGAGFMLGGKYVPVSDASDFEPLEVEPSLQQKINTLLAEGKTNEEIAELVGFNELVAESLKKIAEDTARAESTAAEADAIWRTQIPTPIDSELSPVLPFSEDFLPAAIRPWVKDVSERMSVPLDFAGICALTVIAGCIGRRAFVYPKAADKKWKESICLSGGVVARSGGTKTPVWKVFINPVIENEYALREDYKQRFAQYAANFKSWEAGKKTNPNAPEPEKPVGSKRNLVNDATPEAFHSIMESNPQGLLYYRDELSGWVTELDKKGYEGQRGMFLCAMNGNDPHTMDRIGRGEISAIMCASVFGGFQPDKLKKFLNETSNISDGMIPRFSLLVYPDDVRPPIIDRKADELAEQQFRRIVFDLLSYPALAFELHFDSEAQSVFNEWLRQIELKINEQESDGKASHLSKYKGGLAKLAGLLQLVDMVGAGGKHLVPRLTIDAGHLNQAIRLLAYLESHMDRIYGCIKSPVQIAEAALVKHITRGDIQSGFSIRDIRRKGWSALHDSGIIEDALAGLEEHHWVRIQVKDSGLGGRPTDKWDINPNVKVRQRKF